MTIAPSASSATQAVPQSTSFRVAAGVLVGKAPGKSRFCVSWALSSRRSPCLKVRATDNVKCAKYPLRPSTCTAESIDAVIASTERAIRQMQNSVGDASAPMTMTTATASTAQKQQSQQQQSQQQQSQQKKGSGKNKKRK